MRRMRPSLAVALLATATVLGRAETGDPGASEEQKREVTGERSVDLVSQLPAGHGKHRLVFGTFAESREQLEHVLILAESIRTFAGSYQSAPLWLYLPEGSELLDDNTRDRMARLDIDVSHSAAPSATLQFYFARKVSASAAAERRAQGLAEILVWMDDDTVILNEPKGLLLEQGIALAYRPVTHQNIGSLYSEPPDSFWSRVYELQGVPESAMFPMMTPADTVIIRPYFNAGLLVVRPETGVLQEWTEGFSTLCEDSVLIAMCAQDIFKRIFLHQAALAGAILTTVKHDGIVELPPSFNYPLFFHDRYASKEAFESIEGIVSLRYDVYFRDPEPDWRERLSGPPDVVAWLRERLGRQTLGQGGGSR